MIKSIYIDNFKALNNFTVSFSPLTVLIGGNSSGKSTVLQAIDLIRSFGNMDIDVYLKSRNWNMGDLKSQFQSSQKRTILFKTVFDLQIEDIRKELVWEFSLNTTIATNMINVNYEHITDNHTGKKYLDVSSNKISRYISKEDTYESLPKLVFKSSFLKALDIEKDQEKFPELIALKKFLVESDSFELLSPEKMRQSSRGKTDNIGMGGEKLPAFIRNLKADKKKIFLENLKKYIHFIEGVDTVVKGRPGWIELIVKESFQGSNTKIKSPYVSDGLMRIIAISALTVIDKTAGVMLLDEIEDGINPYLAGALVKSLQDISQSTGRQIIVTTHSSVLLDYFNKNDIVFIWREDDGHVKASKLFESEEMNNMLEYMYPGEVWLNLNEQELLEKVQSKFNQ